MMNNLHKSKQQKPGQDSSYSVEPEAGDMLSEAALNAILRQHFSTVAPFSMGSTLPQDSSHELFEMPDKNVLANRSPEQQRAPQYNSNGQVSSQTCNDDSPSQYPIMDERTASTTSPTHIIAKPTSDVSPYMGPRQSQQVKDRASPPTASTLSQVINYGSTNEGAEPLFRSLDHHAGSQQKIRQPMAQSASKGTQKSVDGGQIEPIETIASSDHQDSVEKEANTETALMPNSLSDSEGQMEQAISALAQQVFRIQNNGLATGQAMHPQTQSNQESVSETVNGAKQDNSGYSSALHPSVSIPSIEDPLSVDQSSLKSTHTNQSSQSAVATSRNKPSSVGSPQGMPLGENPELITQVPEVGQQQLSLVQRLVAPAMGLVRPNAEEVATLPTPGQAQIPLGARVAPQQTPPEKTSNSSSEAIKGTGDQEQQISQAAQSSSKDTRPVSSLSDGETLFSDLSIQDFDLQAVDPSFLESLQHGAATQGNDPTIQQATSVFGSVWTQTNTQTHHRKQETPSSSSAPMSAEEYDLDAITQSIQSLGGNQKHDFPTEEADLDELLMEGSAKPAVIPKPNHGKPRFHFLQPESNTQASDSSSRLIATDGFDVESVRQDFPVLQQQINGKPLIWMDNAATSQKPQVVIDALAKFYQQDNSNVHRGAHELARRSTNAYEGAREKVQRFLGAGASREIVFTRGTTEAINLVANTYGRKYVNQGDEIILTTLEHHSNIVPWQMLAQEKGAVLKFAPIDDQGQVILEEMEQLLSPRTRIVAFSHVSNVLGTVLPVQAITEMAHRYGAVVLVDGAQAVPHFPISVRDLEVDFYVFSGHKLFAPTGIGALYGRAALLEDMPPWQGGGNMIDRVTYERATYNEIPHKFEAGTGNIADAVGLGASIDYLDQIGLEVAARHEHMLLDYATVALNDIPGLRQIGTAPGKVSTLSFILDGIRPEDLAKFLDREGIAVRAGHHCAQPTMDRYGVKGTVRPSLAFYNTQQEVDALIDAILRAKYVL